MNQRTRALVCGSQDDGRRLRRGERAPGPEEAGIDGSRWHRARPLGGVRFRAAPSRLDATPLTDVRQGVAAGG